MADVDSAQRERRFVIVYCPECSRELHRAPSTGNATNHLVPADAPCPSCDDDGRGA